MLLTLYNITEASGNPSALTSLLPGGAAVQTSGTTAVPFLASPRLEQVIEEVLDATTAISSANALVASPAVNGNLLVLNPVASNSGAPLWVIPNQLAGFQPQAGFAGWVKGIVVKNGSTASIDDTPVGSGSGAMVVVEGPANALCVTPSSNTTVGGGYLAITYGTPLTSDGTGNLMPIQAPSAAPTPTVTQVGTSGSASVSYALVAVSANGTYSAIGTAGSQTSGNATLTTIAYNKITWTPNSDAVGYIVIRVTAPTTPSTTGVIGYVPAGGSQTFSDYGLDILTGTTATQPFELPAAGPTPTVAQVSGATSGSTTWQYKLTSIAKNGIWGAEGTSGSVTTGNATLSTTNANKITWTNASGVDLYAVDRTAAGGTPSTTGLIGFASSTQATSGFIDYGIAATTFSTSKQSIPSPTPGAGVVVAIALGTLAASTTTATSVPVFVR